MTNKSTLAQGLSHAWPWTKPIGSSPTTSRLLRYSLLCMLVLLCGGSAWAQDKITQYTFEKVTSNEGLVVGEKYAIVYENGESSCITGALADDKKSYGKVDVAVTDNKIVTTATGITTFTLGGNSDAYTLSPVSGDYLGLAKYENSQTIVNAVDDNSKLEIIINDGVASIKNIARTGKEGSTTYYCYYNYNSGSSMFRFYKKGSQKAVALYKLTKTEQVTPKKATTITLSEGYTTSGMEGTTIDLPTATVMAGETAVTGATVNWSSSDEEIATIGDGVINLLKPGNVTITASFEEDDNYLESENGFELTVTESPEIANPYTYTFEAKVFDAKEQTKKLSKVNWALKTDGNYFGYDGSKGQQFGSGSAPAKTLTLSTSDIPGTITSIKINTSGASSIAATISVTIGGTAFKCDDETTAGLTSTATDYYTFNGSASGDIIISYNQTSSKAIYIKSIEIAYTEETTPNPLYILGSMNGWERTDATEMTWDAENEVYTYNYSPTEDAFFVITDKKMTEEEVNADSDWSIFNSNYRWALGEGDTEIGQESLNTPLQLQKINGAIKLPAGTWTISVTADMIMTITGEATPVEEHTYIVAGSEAEIFGTSWDGTNEANKMTKQTDGTYQKTYTVTEAYNNVQLKVVKDNDKWYGDANDNNIIFNLTGAGDFTVTINPETNVVSVTGDIVQFPTTFEYENVFAAGNGEDAWLNGANWDPGYQDNQMTEISDGVWEISFENVPEGYTRKIKFAIDGAWTHNFGGTFSEFGVATDAVYNGGDIVFDTENDLQNIKVQLDLRNFDFTTKEGAKFTITSEPVEEPEPFVFRDIKLDLTVQGFLTDDEYNNKSAVTAKLLVDEEGNISRNDEATEPNATVTGNTRKDSHGWDNFTMTVPVTGIVKITVGGCQYNSGNANVLTVTPEGGEAFTIDAPAVCWHNDKTKNVKSGYFDAGENLVTLTITGPQFTPYVAIEAVDEIPSIYTVTYAKDSDVEGTIPAEVEVTIGEAITLPKNYTLYKEGYTQTGWTDGATTYELGGSFTPEDDVTLTAVFTENTVNLADRTETVSISWALGQKSGDEGVEYNGKKGVVVTRAAVNNKRIDAKLDVDATNGKFNNKRNDDLAQINANTKLTIPACKGAIITVKAYATGYNLTIDGTAMTDNGDKTYTYTVADEKESIDIIPAAQVYLSFVNVTLPVVDGSNLLYTWESPTGNPVETGGTIAYVNGDGDRLNYPNNGYYTICLNGKKTNINDATPSANAGKMVITLDKALHEGDKINMTAYITNSASKTASAYVLFETGTSIDGEDYSDAANIGFATPGTPTTTTITVPKAAAGSKTITLTRSKTGTNLFITKLVITTTAEDDPNAVATPEITPATGTYTTDKEVAITCETEDAKIYYTTDGTDPTAQSTEYTEAFTVTETTTIKAIAIKGEYSSEIAESVITIKKDLQPGESNLEWDYTEKEIPTTSPDNGLNYAGYVNDAAGTNNGLHGVKLNSSGYAWFTKNPVEGKLTLTFGNRKAADAYAVNVYSCDANGTKGDKIGEVSVAESPGTGSIDIAADVTGIYIERSTSAEGVLQKIVFKEKVARTFVDFEITNEELKGTYDPSKLPQGVEFSGTPHNDSHGYQNVTLKVPTDGGAVKFTIGGCQYANPATFTVKNAADETLATLDEQAPGCYHNGGTLTYFYTGEATTLTFGPMAYLPYFKAEAVEVEEVTVTYKDQNGEVLGTKKVIEGSAIGEVPYTEANLTIPEGEKFRGWVYASGVKVQATDIVSGSITVKASVTPIETVTEGSIQTYDLTKSTFYPEDHETITVENAAWHDSQHGFSVANGSTISVQTAGKAQVVVTLCQHSSEGTVTVKDANGNPVGEGFNAKVATCGTTAVVNYNGEATWLTFTFSATAYIHSIKVYNVTDFVEKDEESGWYIVPANDGVGLVLALNAASQEADGANIFLPNGTYDLGETVLTAIGGKNVSLIGESMDGVIIKNAPPVANEGLKTTATLHNTGENLYLQDLTIQNALDYYSAGSAGRGIAFWDEGKHTIAKNVKLLSYQDTYLSTVNQQFYWETSEIHGAVDFICGGSDVFFESTKIVTESRAATGKSGEATITAPQPGTQEQFGYVFNNCTIENNAAKFNLGRAWGGNSGNGPKQAYLNTTIMQPDEIISTRFTTAGMNEAAKSFKEYNSMNKEGTVISPTSNILKFTHSTGNYEYETILSETEAANYALDKVFTSWTPATYTKQVAAPKAELQDGVITWEKVDGATAYAIFKDGKFLGITTGSEWTIEEVAGAPALRRAEEPEKTGYTIRAANSRGGFGPAADVSPATGIAAIEAELGGDVKIYDLNGRRVMTPTKGVYIINGKKVVIK